MFSTKHEHARSFLLIMMQIFLINYVYNNLNGIKSLYTN